MTRIETPRLLLRPFDESDFDALHAVVGDPEVARYQGWEPCTEDETREFLRRAQASRRDPDSLDVDLAIVLRDPGRVVGGCSLRARRLMLREFEIGWTLHRAYWRHGIATEAGAALMEHAFETLDAHHVYAIVDPSNAASMALSERLGLRVEGRRRSSSRIRGRRGDALVLGRMEAPARGIGR